MVGISANYHNGAELINPDSSTLVDNKEDVYKE
jgi:hypothetical protein